MMDSLQAWCLLVDFVDTVGCVGKRGVRLAGVCIDAKEFGYGGFFSSILLKGVPDAGSELRGGGEDDSLGRVNGAVEAILGDRKPEMAGIGDKEMDTVGIADTLKLNIIHVELEWDMSVDGSVCFKGFEAVEGNKKHCHDASCPYSAVGLRGRANHSVVLHSSSASVALDGEAKERYGEMVFVSTIKESVMADAGEEFVFVPYDLGACEAIGMADFGGCGGAPGCIDCVPMLPTGDFRCLVCLLPAVDEGTSGSHKNTYKAGCHVEIAVAAILFLD